MAIQRDSRYPGRWETADADYPLGGPKNRTTAESKDGTYLEKDWIADYEAFFQALMSNAGFSANGNADTAQASQFYDALIEAVNDNLTPEATPQEALDGDNVAAYMPPDLVHKAFNQYGLGSNDFQSDAGIDGSIISFDIKTGFYEAVTASFGGTVTDTPTDFNYGTATIIRRRSNQSEIKVRDLISGREWYRIIQGDIPFDSGWIRYITAANEQQIGVGQTTNDVTASRTANEVYTNNTGKPVEIRITVTCATTGQLQLFRDGLEVGYLNLFNNDDSWVGCIVPDGSTYELNILSGFVVRKWMELS